MEPPFSHDDIAFLMPKLERIARELVSVPGSADDLLQDAWLEALQAGPQSVRHPLRWMRVIMRRRSTKLRTRARLRSESEKLAAQFEARNDEEAELASTTALVVSELARLDSPYREVLRMRFLEERSIREIAEQSGSSAETVRSQVHRGLARLRDRLDRRAGSRDLWTGVLLQAARIDRGTGPAGGRVAEPPPAPPAPTAVGAGLTGAALVASALAFWLWPDAPPLTGVARTSPVPVVEAGELEAAASEGAARLAAAAPGDPEPGIPEVGPSSESAADRADDASRADVPADGTRLVLLVEDADGLPVPDARAEVYGVGIRSLHDGPVGPEGRLELDIGVSELFDEFPLVGAITMAACSDELTRPEMLVVEMEPGRERTLRVRLDRPAVSLYGRVVDREGEPIPGALVETQVAAIEQRELEPGVRLAPLLLWTFTDENGEYRLDGVVAERLAVVVSKPGFVLLTSEATPAGAATRADFTLGRGAIVAGFVSHADGRPAGGARVWVGTPSARQRLLPEAHADEDGFFLMSGLGDGEWEVFACDPAEPHLFAWSRVLARDGEESPFEAVLEPTSGVRVRVLDREGAPFAGAGVVVAPTEPRSTWSALASTDTAGRAQFLHLPDVPLDVRVYPTELRGNGDGAAFRSGVRAGGPELTLQMTATTGQVEDGDARLRGTLLRADGEPLAGALVYAVPGETAAAPALTPSGELLFDDAGVGAGEVQADGSFVVDELSPGEHRLVALSHLPECAGALDLGHCTVLPGETFDLGTRRAPPGRVVRFELPTSGEILLAADLGSFWRACMRQRVEGSLELRILDGTYWVGTREQGVRFSVPGEAVIPLPE